MRIELSRIKIEFKDIRLDDEPKSCNRAECTEEQNGNCRQQERDNETPPSLLISLDHISDHSYSPWQSRIALVYNHQGNNERQEENDKVPAIWSIGVLLQRCSCLKAECTEMKN